MALQEQIQNLRANIREKADRAGSSDELAGQDQLLGSSYARPCTAHPQAKALESGRKGSLALAADAAEQFMRASAT